MKNTETKERKVSIGEETLYTLIIPQNMKKVKLFGLYKNDKFSPKIFL